MRVVVTRPETSGQKTAALLRARSHDPILLPLTRPVHYIKAATEVLEKHPAALAVTSAEAVRVLAECGPMNLRTSLFAVGHASADEARKAGFKNVCAGNSDGLALAQLIAEALESGTVPRGTLVYLAGKPREPGFENRLSALKVPFETVEIYEMRPISWQRTQLEDLLAGNTIDAVVFYSGDAVRQFFTLMTDMALLAWLGNCQFICISEKVLSHIPKTFRHAATASTTPTEAEMFELLGRNAGT